MNITKQSFTLSALAAVVAVTGVSVGMTGSAHAAASTDQTKLTNLVTRGDQEISRRLTTLGTLSSKINANTKLNATDKTTITNEVSSTQSGLTALKTKLDTETTVAGARTDVQSIYTEYRVYALVVPKVNLIRTADNQQTVADHLSDAAAKLQTEITAAANSGKDTASLQTKLDNMKSQISSAQSTASTLESSIISLQPSDYNSDHALLSGDRDKLKASHTQLQTAETDGKAIASGLKTL